VFQKLVSHNKDIQRLIEKGYAVGFDSKYMIVRDIPYLDANGDLKIGAIVTKLVFTDNEHVVQDDHQIFFAGSHPYNLDGSPIANLAGGPTSLALSEAAADVKVERQFSNKPRVNGHLVGFPDFFEKIESYVGLFSGPAKAKCGAVANPLTFRSVEEVADDSVFKIHDTLTSRAEISDLSALFKDEVVAIIGLGGTGAYLLDFLTKTPVKEIRGFDLDPFHVHNVFRAPGRFDEKELRQPKAEVYQARYENFRHGLSLKAKFIDASCGDDFEGVTFAFVCVDKGSSRAGIFELLMAKEIPFIDVGMGLNRKRGPLSGMMRATYYSPEDSEKVKNKALAELSDRPADEYRKNIQIGELNALNAILAIIKYKQLKGFYFDEIPNYHFLFDVSDCKVAARSIQSLHEA
jgi:hypothetical protein